MEYTNIDDTTWDDGLVFDPNGRPLTGIAYDAGNDSRGRIETSYVGGMQEGEEREWYINGALASASNFRKGVRHGEQRKYMEDGTLVERSEWEFDICTRRVKYSADSTVIDMFEISDSHPLYRTLAICRSEG